MFDNIDRSLLWQKLVTENVSSKLINALKAMYSSIQSCIKINQHHYTEYIISTIGIKLDVFEKNACLPPARSSVKF